MFRSSVYLGSLTLVCALFFVGSVATADLPEFCENVTVVPPNIDPDYPRVSSTQKGSLIVFSKVEIRWDASGNLLRDTFIDLSNDYPADVHIQGYMINGDRVIPEQRDQTGAIIQQFEPGWNTADCRFELTGNQPTWWSAARGGANCQPFSVLDPQGPGRPDPESSVGGRVLRGFVVFWAVKFERSFGPTGRWVEINWNHLKGDAVIVDYETGAAWEYNAWAFRAAVGDRGLPLGTPGALLLGGEYDAAFNTLILDFYRPGSVFSSPDNPTSDVTVQSDTIVTLHPVDLDLRQDGCGPLLTKAEFQICNESEICFGTTRCVCCWDTFRINLLAGISFGTDKLKARIEGASTDVANCQYSEVCGVSPLPRKETCGGQICEFAHCPGPGCENFAIAGYSEPTPLLGVAVKRLSYSPNARFDMAGMNMHGSGAQRAVILTDVEAGPSELRKEMDRGTRTSDAR